MFKEALSRIEQLLALKKNKTHYADCVIRDERGRICLLHRSYQDDFAPGKWCLPGGHIEDGEEPIFAAGRELEEETGYKDVPLFYLDKVDRKDSVSLYYEGFVFSQTAVLLDNDEHYRIQWVELKDLDDYELLLDLKDTLAKLPLSPVPTLPEVAPIGEDLYTSWQNNLTSFDEGKIDESVFFKTVEIHKAVAAYELVTRAFDNDEITPEEFSRVHKVEKAEGFDQALELAKGTDTEVLEEIVKGGRKAIIGEKRTFGGREYIKTTDGWKFHGKGTGEKAQEHVKNSTEAETKKEKINSLSKPGETQTVTLPNEQKLTGIIKRVSLKSIKPSEEHAIKDNETAKEMANGEVSIFDENGKESNKSFGKLVDPNQLPPIVIDKNGLIIDGNNRYSALTFHTKLKEVNVIQAPYTRQEWIDRKIEKMNTGSTPGFETVTENGKLVKSEDKEITKADHTKWL